MTFPRCVKSLSVALVLLGMVGLPAAAQDDTVDVVLEVYTCPAGTDPSTDPAQLLETCLEPAPPVSITVGDGSTWATGAETTGEAPQVAQFEDLEAGALQIVQSLPDGMGEPVVTCTKGDPADQAVVFTYELPSDAFEFRAFAQKVEPGTTLSCRIFNLPLAADALASPVVAEPGMVMTFRSCPANVDLEVPLSDLIGTCQELLGVAAVTVTGEGHAGFSSQMTAGASSIEVLLENLPAGTLELKAVSEPGTEVGRLACAEVGAESVELEVREGSTVEWTYVEGSSVACDVFMVPASSATPEA